MSPSAETIAGPARTTSHVELSEVERERVGMAEAPVRDAVGIEDAADLIDDPRAALEAA